MGAALCARDNRARDVSTTWVDREVAGCEFRDARLGKRFRTLLERIGSDIGQSIRIGQTLRRRTVSSPIIESAKQTFCLAISSRRVSVQRQWTALFSYFTTRPSSPINGIGRS